MTPRLGSEPLEGQAASAEMGDGRAQCEYETWRRGGQRTKFGAQGVVGQTAMGRGGGDEAGKGPPRAER